MCMEETETLWFGYKVSLTSCAEGFSLQYSSVQGWGLEEGTGS